MVAYTDRAEMASQRERVLLKADEIVDLLALGVSIPHIQKRVGLDDMPDTTFYYHARKLREASGIPASAHGRRVGEKYAAKLSSPAPAEEAVKPDLDPQPKRASPENPGEDAPKKMPPKRRKYVSTGTDEPKTDEQGYDPSKWKKLEI